jgi:hypothetical protein
VPGRLGSGSGELGASAPVGVLPSERRARRIDVRGTRRLGQVLGRDLDDLDLFAHVPEEVIEFGPRSRAQRIEAQVAHIGVELGGRRRRVDDRHAECGEIRDSARGQERILAAKITIRIGRIGDRQQRAAIGAAVAECRDTIGLV